MFSSRCTTYQHLATRTKLFCFLSLFFSFFLELTPEMKTTKMSPVLERLPSSSWEHLCHLQSALVFMQQYHYFTTQAPCSLPYLKSFMRNPAKNNRLSPLGSGHENGGIHRVFFLYPPLFLFANSTSFFPHRHSSDARHLPP